MARITLSDLAHSYLANPAGDDDLDRKSVV